MRTVSVASDLFDFSGTLAEKNSSTVYEHNDHFITEAYVECTQESVTEQRFPEDFDYDDITIIGQTLFNAYRRRDDHSEGEGLSSGLSSSSSMSHDKTGQPVVDRDTSHESGYEIQRQNLKTNRLELSWTDKGSRSSLTVERRFRKHEFQADYDRRSIQQLNEKIESQQE